MTFRLLGLPEELRLAIEQAGGEPTEEARVIVEAAVQEAVSQVQQTVTDSLRELQSIIGPHGTITRLQTGGIRIANGEGIGVYLDGVLKTNIQPNGTLVVGSDISLPETTTEIFFVENTVYNNEEFGAGDFLIGDNSSGTGNAKWDASAGQLQFRGGTTVQAYVDTDGTIKAGDGAITLDVNGIILDNVSGKIQFKNTSGERKGIISYLSSNFLSLQNDEAGKGIVFTTVLSDATTPYFEIKEFPDSSGTASYAAYPGGTSGRFAFGTDHYIDFLKSDGTGSATVYFNERNKDIDFLVEGATDESLLIVDAGLDAVGIGGAAESGKKLTVTGAAKVTGGISLGNSGIRNGLYTVADDAATSFTPAAAAGAGIIISVDATVAGTFLYNTTVPATIANLVGTNTNVTTGVLAGTTGTDTKFTVSCHTDGKLYFENRRGSSCSFYLLLL